MTFDFLYKLLLEMPQRIDIDLKMEETVPHIKKVGRFVEKVKLNNIDYDVWEVNNGDIDLYFIHNDKVIAAEVGFYPKKHGIEENLIQQNRQYKGLARAIYMEYLLKKYSYILSDTTMTSAGVGFWIKLYEQYKDTFVFSIYEISTKLNRYIHSTNDMKRVHGKNKKFHNYRFMVQHKQ